MGLANLCISGSIASGHAIYFASRSDSEPRGCTGRGQLNQRGRTPPNIANGPTSKTPTERGSSCSIKYEIGTSEIAPRMVYRVVGLLMPQAGRKWNEKRVPAKVCEKDHSTKDLDCAVYGEKEKKNPPIQQFCFLIPFFLMYQRELRDWGLRQTQYAFDLTYGDLREDFRSELRGSSPRKRPGGKKSIRSISSLSHTTTTQEYVWAGKDLSQKTYETL
ncbi:hypothetical protein HNY73_003284 [Argiope bruennichi]|uniref:Uncharacterized protein n=1 Tax=Argiope bruennichi TaxID=94029 RepID=A0A8T0FWF2_ARGBR|nr:hypothetical protein HNY73_003284 [Argiope bruennichi]